MYLYISDGINSSLCSNTAEFIFPPLSDHCSGFTLVDYIDCADVALRV